jgi:hypothetical protein
MQLRIAKPLRSWKLVYKAASRPACAYWAMECDGVVYFVVKVFICDLSGFCW